MKTQIVEIYGRRTIECIFECISKLNNSSDGKIIIRAYSSNINTGIKIAQILKKHVGVEVQKTEMKSMMINDNTTSFIDIPIKLKVAGKLHRGKERTETWISDSVGHSEFINYSTYQIVFDWFYSKEEKIEIFIRDKEDKSIKILSIFEDNKIKKYEPLHFSDNGSKDKNKEISRKRNDVIKALYKSGVLMPIGWEKIAKKLSSRDDVILGLDTNILMNCSVTEHLLPIVSLIETREFVNTPNWILLIVPSTVMYELEKNSNSRNTNNGHLSHFGMQAYRGLQEILELNQNIDISGVSLLIAGENNPILDLQNTIKPLSKNIYELCKQKNNSYSMNIQLPAKSSGEDMMIRHQFRQFISQINFHKNTFFLTADKTSAALAMTEGVDSIYIPDPVINGNKNFPADSISDGVNTLRFDPTIGNVIYEMAVSFGCIYVKVGEKIIQLSPDKKGDSLGRWLRKQLRVSKEDLTSLLHDYDGKIDVTKAVGLFEEMSSRFENIDWMIDMNKALKV